MALKSVVDSLDDIAEEHKTLYVEKKLGDKTVWALDIEGTSMHPDVATLRTAHERTKTERDRFKKEAGELQAKLDAVPDDIDPEEYKRLKAEEEERIKDPNNKPDVAAQQAMKKQYEERLAASEKKRQEETAALQGTIDSERQQRAVQSARGELSTALLDVGVDKKLMRAAEALHAQNIQTRRNEEDGAVESFFTTDLGEVPVRQFIESWSKTEDGKAFVPKPSGGGADGGKPPSNGAGEKNPWKSDTLNRTEQGQIIKSDRVKAGRMMKSAGMTDDQVRRILGGGQQAAA